MASTRTSNAEIAGMLDRIGDLLEIKGENPFRVSSYRRAATLVKDSERSFARLAAEQGAEGLTKIRGIGEKLAAVIEEFVNTGKIGMLEELEKEAEGSASKIQKPLSSPSTPAGRTGSARLKATRSVAKSDRGAGRGQNKAMASRVGGETPPVSIILEVDKEYRKRAAEGSLKLIAPKKFNPEGTAWLPIFSTARKDWKFTVMFSNTALAHELGKTGDWVVIYFEKEGEEERQCTVVTEHRGELTGKRVVRGRESESQEYYRSL